MENTIDPDEVTRRIEFYFHDVFSFNNKKKIIVEIHDTMAGFKHRLVVNDVVGPWATYREVAQNEIYRYCTEYYRGIFPTEIPFIIQHIEVIKETT